MSLLFPDQLRIGLGASYAVLAKVSGHKVTHWRMQTWDAAGTTATSWDRALPVISGWLTELNSHRLSATVTLSTELAPLHLLPWREEVTSSEKQALLAKASFRRVYGETADHWKIIAQPSGYGLPWLASAIDSRLLKALTDLQGGSLFSVMPLSLSLFNAVQTKLTGPSYWVLMPEHQRLAAIYLRDGDFSLLQSLPINSVKHESIKDLLLRETQLAGLQAIPSQIYVASAKFEMEGCTKIDVGWKTDARVPADSPLHLLGGCI